MANYHVLLVCAGGMSSSLLENSAREAAQVAGHTLTIHAVSAGMISAGDFDTTAVELILLAPQVRFLQKVIAKKVAPFGIVVQSIEPITFGMMDGAKVFEQIMNAIPKEKRNE